MRIYEPLSDSMRIHYPLVKSEFDIQAELWSKLVNDGFRVCGSLNILRRSKNAGVEFDLVVFNKRGSAQAIVEVKREDEGHRVALDQTIQGVKYRQFGVPVILFWDMSYYDELKKWLVAKSESKTENGDGLRFEESKKHLAVVRLRDLRRRLDVAAMAAFDVKTTLPQFVELKNIESELEKFRDRIDELYRSL